MTIKLNMTNNTIEGNRVDSLVMLSDSGKDATVTLDSVKYVYSRDTKEWRVDGVPLERAAGLLAQAAPMLAKFRFGD